MSKGKKKQQTASLPVIENRRAYHEYFIDETFTVGIALVGTEVKAIREGQVSLAEGFVRVDTDRAGRQELWLHSVNIADYGPGGSLQHRRTRPRKLLAHRREINKLAKAATTKGMTIIPLKMEFHRGLVKLVIGVARGKASHDKRHTIAKKDAQRDIQRAMSKKLKY